MVPRHAMVKDSACVATVEVAQFAFQEKSLVTKPVTLCSLIAPLGMRREKEKMRAKQGGWNKIKKKKELYNPKIKAERKEVK